MTPTNINPKQIMFILVCLDNWLITRYKSMGSVPFGNWMRNEPILNRVNDGLCNADTLIKQWSKLCQSQS